MFRVMLQRRAAEEAARREAELKAARLEALKVQSGRSKRQYWTLLELEPRSCFGTKIRFDEKDEALKSLWMGSCKLLYLHVESTCSG